MSGRATREAAALLEGLGHHDLIDSPDTHSRSTERHPRGGRWYFEHGLGMRRLWNFRAVHRERLSAALARFPPRGLCAEGLAWRGRLKRLLGEEAAARRDLESSLRRGGGARAAAWLGELDAYADPARASAALERAVRLDAGLPWPYLWRALVHLRASRPRKALEDLGRFGERSEKPLYLASLLRYQAMMDLGDPRGAQAAAEAARRLDPGCPAAYDMLGRIHHGRGDEAGALASFHRARDRDMDVEGSYLFERMGADMGHLRIWENPREYLRQLDAAVARFPGSAVLLAERAELKRDARICLYEEALRDYEQAARLAPECGWIWAVLGRAKNNLRGGRAGLDEFARAVRHAPDSGWILAWRGAVLARLGERPAALADFAACVERMPWYSFAYAWRGALLNRLSRHAEALADLDTAIRLDPHYTFSYYERFQSRKGLKDYAGAVADLNLAFRADPKYTWVVQGSSRPAEALAGGLRELDEAVRRRPAHAWLRAWRGRTRVQGGNPRAALADLDRAAALDPDDGVIRAWRGQAYAALGRTAEAVADLRRAVALAPEAWSARKALAELHARAGDLSLAVAEMAEVVRLAPTTVSFLVEKASYEHALGRHEEAVADLERATQLDAGFAQAHLLLAKAQLARGRLDAAIKAADAALALPDAPAMAFVVRGMARQGQGDAAGQAADFKRALERDPRLFSAEERRAIARLAA